MPQDNGETLQIRSVDSDKAAEFKALAARYKLSHAQLFGMLLDHAFESVSRLLKEEKEERKEREKSAAERGPRRRNGVGGGSNDF